MRQTWRRPGAARRTTSEALVDDGWVSLDPVVYEDFLPRSAAGIFRSNLAGDGAADATVAGVERDAAWLAGALGRDLHDPMDLYAAEVDASWARVRAELGVAT